MTMLDEAVLAQLRGRGRPRKLTNAERLAAYAFSLEGVPPRVIARTFGVSLNAIYYIINWKNTVAYQEAAAEYERLGKARVFAEIVTQAQTLSINDGMRRMAEGRKLDDRGYRRLNRRGVGARRAGTAAWLSEAASDGEGGRAASD